jgi:hypothetical protein
MSDGHVTTSIRGVISHVTTPGHLISCRDGLSGPGLGRVRAQGEGMSDDTENGTDIKILY